MDATATTGYHSRPLNPQVLHDRPRVPVTTAPKSVTGLRPSLSWVQPETGKRGFPPVERGLLCRAIRRPGECRER